MILIDTTPLVALCSERDSSHEIAVAQLAEFAAEQLVTCEAVLLEACFHLPHAAQRKRLMTLLSTLNIAAIAGAAERSMWNRVFEWLEKYAEHEADWADACIAVLCGQNPTLKVWTYDSEFRTIWRRPDGSRIPLAVK